MEHAVQVTADVQWQCL